MDPQSLLHKLEDLWLGAKIAAAKWVAAIFALAAILAFGVVAFKLGGNALDWLKSGIFTPDSETIAEAFPATADMLRGLNWMSAQRACQWAINQSVLWGYVALGVLCLVICGLFLELADRLHARRRFVRPAQMIEQRDEDFGPGPA